MSNLNIHVQYILSPDIKNERISGYKRKAYTNNR